MKSKRREVESAVRALQRKEQRSAMYLPVNPYTSSSRPCVEPQDNNLTAPGDDTYEHGTLL